MEEYENATKLDETNALYFYSLRFAHRQIEQEMTETFKFTSSIANDAKDPWAHYDVGMSLMKSMKLDKSEESLRKAVKLAPNFAEAYYGLGQLYCKKEMVDDAVKMLKKAASINGKYADPHKLLGNIYMQDLGLVEKAMEEFEIYRKLKRRKKVN